MFNYAKFFEYRNSRYNILISLTQFWIMIFFPIWRNSMPVYRKSFPVCTIFGCRVRTYINFIRATENIKRKRNSFSEFITKIELLDEKFFLANRIK